MIGQSSEESQQKNNLEERNSIKIRKKSKQFLKNEIDEDNVYFHTETGIFNSTNENEEKLYDSIQYNADNNIDHDSKNSQSPSLELLNVEAELNNLINLFNSNPKKAIPLLCRYYYHSDDIAAPIIAHILHTTPGLQTDKIISYLTSLRCDSNQNSNRNESINSDNDFIEKFSPSYFKNLEIKRSRLNIYAIPPSAVLKAYFDEMNLKVSLMDAMRTCLEATNFLNCSFDKMDYILKIFSYSYYEQNKSGIKVSYVYFAVLSIILLNNEILRSRSDDNHDNLRIITPDYYDIIIKHIFPENYLQLFCTRAVYRRVNKKPFTQRIFNPEEIKIHFKCRIEKKTNKWNSTFRKRFLWLNNNRLVLYQQKGKMIPTNFLLISPNLTIQAEKKYPSRVYVRSSSFIYKNKKKARFSDSECYTSIAASAKKRYQNGVIEDFSHVYDINILSKTDSNSIYAISNSTAPISSLYGLFNLSEKGESLLYAHFGGNDGNSSVYKKNIGELVLQFESLDECKACSFALKKMLLLSFFIDDTPPLTIPPAFLDF